MGHASDIDLIELVGGRTPPARRAALEGHLASCPACRERREAFADTWQALGAWEVPPAERDLAPAVVAAAGRQVATPVARARRWARPLLSAAASILIAAGLGRLAGEWVLSARTPAPIEADEQAVAESLSLGALEAVPPTGIADSVLDLGQPAPEEGKS